MTNITKLGREHEKKNITIIFNMSVLIQTHDKVSFCWVYGGSWMNLVDSSHELILNGLSLEPMKLQKLVHIVYKQIIF